MSVITFTSSHPSAPKRFSSRSSSSRSSSSSLRPRKPWVMTVVAYSNRLMRRTLPCHEVRGRGAPRPARRSTRRSRSAKMARVDRQEARMTSKEDFTDDEWTRLKRAPFVAGMAISLADPGGPIEAVKETAATLKTVRAAEGGDRGELVGALATEVVADAGQRKNPLGGFKPSSGANAGVEILGELGEVNRIVAE